MIIIITDDTGELYDYLYKKNLSVKFNTPEGIKLTFVFILI